MSKSLSVLIVVALVLAGVVFSEAQASQPRDLVLVSEADWTDVRAIEEHDIIVNGLSKAGIEAEATRAQQATLISMGYDIEVITPNIDQVYRNNSMTVDQDAWYMPYTHFRDTMITIAQNNSSFIKLETLGYSVAGRLLLVMKFSDNPQVHENEPPVHFEANIHGDEAITFGNHVEMVKYLASSYGTDTFVTRLINEREIWIAPLVNPDGYEGHNRRNNNNVDLNRNWGRMWGNATAPGSSPMSEPETRAFVAHFMRHPFMLNASYHSGTKYLAYPWSYSRYDTIPEKPLLHFLSQRYTSYNGYPYGQGAVGMYPFNGAAKDLEYAWGSLTWSIEIHNTKWPAASQIIPTFNLNRGAMLELWHHMSKGIHGTVTDADTDRPIAAQVWVSPANWPSYNDTALGDYHRFYLPGTYSLTFRSPGYHDTTITGVVVPNHGDSTVVVNAQLSPDISVPLFGFRLVYSRYVATSSNHTFPNWALGLHDGKAFKLDNGKYICIDMYRPIHDQTGVDLTVYRSSGSGSATVKGSNSWTGPWTTIGTANSAQTSFDLSSTSLDSARYIRLDASSTFYFDAVEGVNYTGVAGDRKAARSVPLGIRLKENPCSGPVRFSLSQQPEENLNLLIYDPTGRLVRTLPASSTELVWNRLDNSNRAAPAGIYFARLDRSDASPVRVVIAR